MSNPKSSAKSTTAKSDSGVIPCRECGKFNVANLPYDGVHCQRCFDKIQYRNGGVYGLRGTESMYNILSRYQRTRDYATKIKDTLDKADDNRNSIENEFKCMLKSDKAAKKAFVEKVQKAVESRVQKRVGKRSNPSDVLAKREQKNSDTKQMCKYGSLCYRTNPLHLGAFKHPERTARHVMIDSGSPTDTGAPTVVKIHTPTFTPAAQHNTSDDSDSSAGSDQVEPDTETETDIDTDSD